MRGASADEVKQNQRHRLFAAMIACVAERGYAATTIEDLVELSGVSRRSFYDNFQDKATCLREAVEEIFARGMGVLGAEGGEDLEARSLHRYQRLVELAIAQPAASKVSLNDSFAAGPEGVEPLNRMIRGYEDLVHRNYEASPEHAGMPAELITARVGGVLEILRARLRSGSEAQLPSLGRDIVALSITDRPPPEPLRLSTRLPKPKPESLDAADHAERAIRAFALLVADRGYPNVKVDDVVRAASMSTTTFYANFTGKDDLMAAAIDSACAQAIAAVVPPFNRQESLPEAVRAGFGGMLNFLASRPALAKLVTVEVYAAGDVAIERRMSALRPLGALLENNTTMWPATPPVIFEMIAGGIAHLLHTAVQREGSQVLPTLAPVCTYLTLSPFLGPVDACKAANGEASVRTESAFASADFGGAAPAPSIPLSEPMTLTPWAVLSMTSARPSTAAEIAVLVDEEKDVVAATLEKLAANGAIEAVGERDGEPVFNAAFPNPLNLMSNRQMEAMEPAERDRVQGFLWRMIRDEVERAMEQARFGNRPESFLTRAPMRVDERGWRELSELHSQTLAASLEIAQRSKERLEETDDPGFEALSMQVTFEAPERPASLGSGTEPSDE